LHYILKNTRGWEKNQVHRIRKGFKNKTWDYDVIWIDVFSNYREAQTSTTNFMFFFFVMSNYDEMNCNIVFGKFTMYSKVLILVIYNYHDSDVGMNGSVKFVET
jgi:hypothetical protein